MSFYILDFKKDNYKKLFILFFITLFSCYIAADIAISSYESRKTTTKYYVNVLSSKVEHMKKRFPDENLDIIFIGSSRTLYHVDSEYFIKKGIPSYNLGLVAHEPLSYPAMLDAALKMNPKAIGIELNTPWLFEDFENRIPTPSIVDIKTQIIAGLPANIILDSTIDYIKKFSLISRYAVTLYMKSEQFFKKITSGYLTNTIKNENKKSAPINKLRYEKLENGDGILFGSDLSINSIAKKNLKDIRTKNVDFINKLISTAQQKGIKVFIFLAASVETPPKFDLDLIKKRIHAHVIDTVHVIPENSEYWADNRHLNNKGREIYSRILLEKLLKLHIGTNNLQHKP